MLRRVLSSPGVLLCAALAVVALVAGRSVVGAVLGASSPLGGGALVPAWGGASDLWHEYLAGYHEVGAGSAASTPPYVGVLALFATVLAGKPWLAVDVILLGCVPAAGLTAFLASRRVTPVLPVRLWLAATYALLPVAMGTVAAGRLGTAVAFVLLPLIGLAAGRVAVGRTAPYPTRFTARRAAWAGGLLVAVAAAFVPLIWLIILAAAAVAAAAWSWLGRATVINAAIMAAVPAVLLVPWTFHLVASPSAFLLKAGLQRTGLAAGGLGPASVLLLSPGGPGLPPVWVTAGLVLPAFCALLLRRRLILVYAGWAAALAGLILALVASRIRVTGPGGTTVNAWPGLATAFAAAGLLLAAAPAVEAAVLALSALRSARSGDASRSGHRSRSGRGSRPDDGGGESRSSDGVRSDDGARTGRRWAMLATVGSLVVIASAPILAAGYWLALGVRGPITAAGSQVLPPFVAAAAAGPAHPRTLVLRQDGPGVSYSVLRSTDPIVGEPELTQDAAATAGLDRVVASLAASAGGASIGSALSQYDIGYILLPAPVSPALAGRLDAAAGLVRLTNSPAYRLWQVAGTVAQAQVIRADGTVVPVASGSLGMNTTVSAGTSGTLVLAEAAGGWSATLNGRPLTRAAQPANGWAQAFVLPAGGGHLVITRSETARDLSLIAELLALLAVLALALPGTKAAAAAAAEPEPAGASGRRRDRAVAPRAGRRKRTPRFGLAAVSPGTEPGAEAARVPGDDIGAARWAQPEPEPDLEPQPAHAGQAASSPSAALAGTPSYSPGSTWPWATSPADRPAPVTGPQAAVTRQAAARNETTSSYEATPSYEADRYETGATPSATAPWPASPAASGPRPADSASSPPASSAAASSPPASPHAAFPPPADVPAADPASPPASPAPAARRPRGAHAARHGKPSRRFRGPAADRPDEADDELSPDPTATGPARDSGDGA